jgi:DNA repair exonuclease SbcCD ATPase subunit
MSHQQTVIDLKLRLARLVATRDSLRQQLVDNTNQLKTAQELHGNTEAARDVVNTVLLATQLRVKEYVEDIVTAALVVVYGDRYGFELEYQIKRNQSEATPWVLKMGERVSPKEEVGGGVCDVCAFAMRLALWSLQTPRPASVFILDEPGRFISVDKQPLFGQMLKMLAEMMGIQIVMVSHADPLIDTADRAWRVTQAADISHVEIISK